MDSDRLKEKRSQVLIQKYLEGKLSADDAEFFVNRLKDDQGLRKELANQLAIEDALYENCEVERLKHKKRSRKKVPVPGKMGWVTRIAAILMVGVIISGYMVFRQTVPSPRAVVASATLPIKIKRQERYITINKGDLIYNGDMIVSGDSRVKLHCFDIEGRKVDRFIDVRERSSLRFANDEKVWFELIAGHIYATINYPAKAHPLVIKTPDASVTVVGTVFELAVFPEARNAKTRLRVKRGAVRMEYASSTVMVRSGQESLSSGDAVAFNIESDLIGNWRSFTSEFSRTVRMEGDKCVDNKTLLNGRTFIIGDTIYRKKSFQKMPVDGEQELSATASRLIPESNFMVKFLKQTADGRISGKIPAPVPDNKSSNYRELCNKSVAYYVKPPQWNRCNIDFFKDTARSGKGTRSRCWLNEALTFDRLYSNTDDQLFGIMREVNAVGSGDLEIMELIPVIDGKTLVSNVLSQKMDAWELAFSTGNNKDLVHGDYNKDATEVLTVRQGDVRGKPTSILTINTLNYKKRCWLRLKTKMPSEPFVVEFDHYVEKVVKANGAYHSVTGIDKANKTYTICTGRRQDKFKVDDFVGKWRRMRNEFYPVDIDNTKLLLGQFYHGTNDGGGGRLMNRPEEIRFLILARNFKISIANLVIRKLKTAR